MSSAIHQIGSSMKVTLHPNKAHWDGSEYSPKSFGETVLAYLDTANGGPFRSLQLGGKLCKVLSLITNNSQFYKGAGDVCDKGWTATIIPRVPGAFVDAKNAVVSLFKTSGDQGSFVRKCIVAVQESTTFAATLGYATSPFLSLANKTSALGKSAFKWAEVSTFVADSCDFVKNASDAVRVRSFASKVSKFEDVSAELKSALAGTHKYHMLKTMKAVCSVASFVMGLGLAATGLAVVPGCALMAATVSLASTLFAASASLHEEGMKYKRVQILSSKHVQMLSPAPKAEETDVAKTDAVTEVVTDAVTDAAKPEAVVVEAATDAAPKEAATDQVAV